MVLQLQPCKFELVQALERSYVVSYGSGVIYGQNIEGNRLNTFKKNMHFGCLGHKSVDASTERENILDIQGIRLAEWLFARIKCPLYQARLNCRSTENLQEMFSESVAVGKVGLLVKNQVFSAPVRET